MLEFGQVGNLVRMVSDEQIRGDGSVNMPWVEKYRPAALTELIAHEEITDARKFCFLSFLREIARNTSDPCEIHDKSLFDK